MLYGDAHRLCRSYILWRAGELCRLDVLLGVGEVAPGENHEDC